MSSRSDLSLRREEHPLPKTVDGIVSLVRDILTDGASVYKFVLESGNSVLVYRRTDLADLTEVEVTLDDALQRSDIYEYSNEDKSPSPFEVLFDMTQVIDANGGDPVCWATGMNQSDLLARWVRAKERGLPGNLNNLLNIPVCRMKVLPEDTLILCASRRKDGDIEDVTLAVKAAIEMRGEEDDHERGEADRPVGDHTGGDSGAAGELEAPSEGGPRGGWIPKSFIGGRMGER